MDYKRLFDKLKCYMLVIFDDDFVHGKPSKKHIIRDFVVMDEDDQNELIENIRIQSGNLADALVEFLSEIKHIANEIAWKDEVLFDDFESAFEVIERKTEVAKLRIIVEKYNAIDEAELIEQYDLLRSYGLCISIPTCYQQLHDEYENSGGRNGKTRIFTDFSAKTKGAFEEILSRSSDEKTIVCIVDNYLKDQYKADEILDCIRTNNKDHSNVIGTVFTSKTSVEQVDEQLCFVYTNKAKPEQLLMNIVRSAYHYFIKRLQDEVSSNIGEAFKKAKENKYIANYLSKRALREGISDYDVIQNWIRLMYEVNAAKSKTAIRLISLAQIIDDIIEDDSDDIPFQNELVDDLNTWEFFDYRVNDYHLPPMPGDIYVTGDGKAYILIGQDCDMMIGEQRQRRVAASELLPVEKLISMNTAEKIHNDAEYVWLANYKHVDDQTYCMQIDYRHRKFIDSRILDLCTYNSNGECFLSMNDRIEDSVMEVLQPHLIARHRELYSYFEAIKQLCMKNGDIFKAVMANDQYLFTSDEFMQTDDGLSFPLRRVCRLKQTCVFFLYKLYLEYRGRQPFETINYAASQPRNIEVTYAGRTEHADFTVKMGSYSFDAHIDRLIWHIRTDKMRELFKNIGITDKIDSRENMMVFLDKETEVLLKSGRKIKFIKKKGNKAALQNC